METELQTDFGYTGQRHNAGIGMMDYNARWYMVSVSRFSASDNIIPHRYDPRSLNRYSYTNNNPVKYTDPSGHYVQVEEGDSCGKGIEVDGECVKWVGPDYYDYGDNPNKHPCHGWAIGSKCGQTDRKSNSTDTSTPTPTTTPKPTSTPYIPTPTYPPTTTPTPPITPSTSTPTATGTATLLFPTRRIANGYDTHPVIDFFESYNLVDFGPGPLTGYSPLEPLKQDPYIGPYVVIGEVVLYTVMTARGIAKGYIDFYETYIGYPSTPTPPPWYTPRQYVPHW